METDDRGKNSSGKVHSYIGVDVSKASVKFVEEIEADYALDRKIRQR